jgi:hypothetical protein
MSAAARAMVVAVLWLVALGAQAQQEPPSPVPYKVGLGVTYALTPMLLSVTLLAEDMPGFAYAAIPVGLLGPPLLHGIVRQRKRAWRSVAGILLSVVGGFAIGMLVGMPIGLAVYDTSEAPADNFGLLVGMAYGAVAGAVAGFVGWGIYDVVTAKYEPPPRRRSVERASIAPVLAPLVSAHAGSTRFEGVVLGLAGRL